MTCKNHPHHRRGIPDKQDMKDKPATDCRQLNELPDHSTKWNEYKHSKNCETNKGNVSESTHDMVQVVIQPRKVG